MKKQNYSRKREAILTAVRSTTQHPSAEWVYQAIKTEYPDISLGTVYRNLAQFKEDGTILSLGVVSGQERFDGNVLPHAHFVCNTCGAVIDIKESYTRPTASSEVNEQYGFTVEYEELVFYGKCSLCSVRH